MNISISIPDPVFLAADKRAFDLTASRNQFYAEALPCYVKAHSASNVIGRPNAVYEVKRSALNPAGQKWSHPVAC